MRLIKQICEELMIKRSIFIWAAICLVACSGDIQVNEVGRVFECVSRDASLIEPGKVIYENQCEACHGADGRLTPDGSRALNPASQFEYQALLASIDNTMPQGNSNACTGDCALKVTEYILDSWCDDPASSASVSSSSASTSENAQPSSSSSSSNAVTGLEVNGNVESGIEPWRGALGSETLSASDAFANSGSTSVYVINRTSVEHGAGQVILGMRDAYDYQISAAVRMDGQVTETLRLRAVVSSLVNNAIVENSFEIDSQSIADTWQTLSGTLSFALEGQLDQVLVAVDGASAGTSFYVDDLLVLETGPTPDPVDTVLIEAGRNLYELQCEVCHGAGINMGLFDNYDIDPNNLQHTTTEQMATYIEVMMPQGNIGRCDSACGEATAAYIQSWE